MVVKRWVLSWLLITFCEVFHVCTCQQPDSIAACLSRNEGNSTLDRWISCLQSAKEAQAQENEDQHLVSQSYNENEVESAVKETVTPELPAEDVASEGNSRVTSSTEAFVFELGLLSLFLSLWCFSRRKQATQDVNRRNVCADEHMSITAPLGFALATVFHEVLERDVFDHDYTEKELKDILTLAVREALDPVLESQAEIFTDSLAKSFGSCYKVMSSVRSRRKQLHLNFSNLQAGFNGLEEMHIRSSATVKARSEVVEVKAESGHNTSEICEQSSTVIVSSPELLKGEPPEHVSEHPKNTDFTEDLTAKFGRLSVSLAPDQTLEQNSKTKVITKNPFEICRNGSWSEAALHTFERSVEAQERSNYIKYFSLLHKVKRLNLKEEELQLATDANSLKKQQVDLNKSRFAFKKTEARDQALLAACSDLCRRCADDFVAGLLVMFCCMVYCSWKHFPLWLGGLQETCTPEYKAKPKFSWQYMSWMYSIAEENGRYWLCVMKGTSGVIGGVAVTVFLVMVVFRRLLNSNNQLMPASIFLVGGCLAGLGGKISIDLLGGNGLGWLWLWGLLCSVHAFSSYFTPVVHGALNRKPDHIIKPMVRGFVFHVLLGLVLPATAGIVAFPRLLQGGEDFDAM